MNHPLRARLLGQGLGRGDAVEDQAQVHLEAAMADGVPVLGYVHWSLLDNFEWFFGYRPHFGIASVDRTTFQRTLKPSTRVLGAIARRNGLG